MNIPLNDTTFNLHLINPFREAFNYKQSYQIIFIYRHITREIFHNKHCACTEGKCELVIDINKLQKETGWTEEMVLNGIKWLQQKTGKFNIIQ